jgi:hypothetical protein
MTAVNRTALATDLERARVTFHRLLAEAERQDVWTAPTRGTRWTNEQLLFHMVFGYMIVLALLRLVHLFSRLPPVVSRGFARILDAGTVPFHAVNYWGACGAAIVFNHNRMGAKLDRVITKLQHHVLLATNRELSRGMHYPTRNASTSRAARRPNAPTS